MSKVLSGRFTDPLRALNTLKTFLLSAKESRAAKKDKDLGPTTSKDGKGSSE